MCFNYADRIKILDYNSKHGVKATLDAVKLWFGNGNNGKPLISTTLFRWKRVYQELNSSGSNRHNYTLQNKLHQTSTKPKSFRSSSYPILYVQFIKLVRKKRFGIGKEKLAKLIEPSRKDIVYAVEQSLEYTKTYNSKDVKLFVLHLQYNHPLPVQYFNLYLQKA